MTLGNGVTENSTVNDRLQTNNIAVKNSSSSLLSLWLYPCPGSSVGPCTNNNGNILSQTIWAPAFANTLIQNYTYDNLNRITQAAETANSATNWSQTFGYDIYGNRTITARSSNLTVSPWEPSTFSATNNRITNTGWVYDSNGNIKQSPGGQTITYDAENHQETFCAGSGGTNCTQYVYDGEGRRVGKINPGASTPTEIYVYMQDGQLAAEYDTSPPAMPCTSCYLIADHLGTTRLITDANGTYVERHDFLPFGEEIIVGGSTDPRYNAGYASGSSWMSLKFTGAERDYESQLDFLQARYLASMQGRFLSPDPGNAGAQPQDPQTWNAYAYVGNNPLVRTDPNGDCFFCILEEIGGGVLDAIGIATGNPELVTIGLHIAAMGGASSAAIGIGNEIDGNGGCGGPLGNCGGLGDDPWSEASPVGPDIQDPGRFIMPAFGDCMQSRAKIFSLAGMASIIMRKDITTGLSGVVGGNVISATFWSVFGSGENATEGLPEATKWWGLKTVVAGAGVPMTVGRRTATIMSLNLAGTRGSAPQVLRRAPGLTKALKGAEEVADVGAPLVIDAGLVLGEAITCGLSSAGVTSK